MSANGDTQWRRIAALPLPAVLAVMVLAGCEYADDVGLSPAAVSPAAASHLTGTPLPSLDAQPDITEARNMTELQRLLGAPPQELLMGGSGGLGGDGFRTSRRAAGQGTYTVTAACVGLPAAHLSISQGRPGSPGLELDLDCGSRIQAKVVLETGPVSSHMESPNAAPGSGGVAGLMIVPAGPEP